MKVILTESMPYHMEDTIIGDIVKSETLKELINNARCRDLEVNYIDNLGHRNTFRIYNAGVFSENEYSRFLDCGELAEIDLLTDYYDIFIQFNTFEKDCFIDVTEY